MIQSRLVALLLAVLLAPACTSQPGSHAAESAPPDPAGLRAVEPTADVQPASPAFTTYDEATEYVRDHYDGESINTSRSSWITSAEYFEADGRGYLILGMKGRVYIFAHVPEDVWEGFKAAPSLGRYYNAVIRGRYGFDLTGESDDQVEDEDEDLDPDTQYDYYRGN